MRPIGLQSGRGILLEFDLQSQAKYSAYDTSLFFELSNVPNVKRGCRCGVERAKIKVKTRIQVNVWLWTVPDPLPSCRDRVQLESHLKLLKSALYKSFRSVCLAKDHIVRCTRIFHGRETGGVTRKYQKSKKRDEIEKESKLGLRSQVGMERRGVPMQQATNGWRLAWNMNHVAMIYKMPNFRANTIDTLRKSLHVCSGSGRSSNVRTQLKTQFGRVDSYSIIVHTIAISTRFTVLLAVRQYNDKLIGSVEDYFFIWFLPPSELAIFSISFKQNCSLLNLSSGLASLFDCRIDSVSVRTG